MRFGDKTGGAEGMLGGGVGDAAGAVLRSGVERECGESSSCCRMGPARVGDMSAA